MMERFALLAAATMLASFLAGVPPGQAAPAPKPSLKVDLWPAEQGLNASYDPQSLTFFGRITLDNVPYAKYEVFLKSCDNPSWATSCTPDYVTFWGTGSADFNISVTVPQLATRQTAKIWVESRATYEDTDVAGNVSGMIYLTVGTLPENGNVTHGGDAFFGPASGGISVLPMVLLAAVICVPVVCIYTVIRWRRKKKAKAD
jgi:hypothetical protein